MTKVRFLRSERGQALVEFALILPILLLVAAGILHFGKMLNYWLDINHLANEGVRYAVVNENPCKDTMSPPPASLCPTGVNTPLQTWVRLQADTRELQGGGTDSLPSSAQVTICFPDGASANDSGDPVRMKIEVTYHLIPLLGFGQIKLRGSATQRIERAPKAPLTPAYDADNGGVCA